MSPIDTALSAAGLSLCLATLIMVDLAARRDRAARRRSAAGLRRDDHANLVAKLEALNRGKGAR